MGSVARYAITSNQTSLRIVSSQQQGPRRFSQWNQHSSQLSPERTAESNLGSVEWRACPIYPNAAGSPSDCELDMVRAATLIFTFAAVHFLLCVASLYAACNVASAPVPQGESNPYSGLASFAWLVFVGLSFPFGGPLNSLLWGLVLCFTVRGFRCWFRQAIATDGRQLN